jgi:hypothetical protein
MVYHPFHILFISFFLHSSHLNLKKTHDHLLSHLIHVKQQSICKRSSSSMFVSLHFTELISTRSDGGKSEMRTAFEMVLFDFFTDCVHFYRIDRQSGIVVTQKLISYEDIFRYNDLFFKLGYIVLSSCIFL